MSNHQDSLSIHDEWKARSAKDDTSICDADFIDRFAKSGEKSLQDAENAAKAAGFGCFLDWASFLCQRVTMQDEGSGQNVLQRFFCLRFSLDAAVRFEDGLAVEEPNDTPSLAKAILKFLDNAAAEETLSPCALGLLGSCMGPSAPLSADFPEAVKLKAFADDFLQTLIAAKASTPPLIMIQSLLGLLFIESLFQGRVLALDVMMKRLNFLADKPIILMKIGHTLYDAGAYENLRQDEWHRFLAPGRQDGAEIETMSLLLFTTFEAPPLWNEKLYDEWLLPNISHALESGDFCRAQRLRRAIACHELSPYLEAPQKKVMHDYFPVLEKSASAFSSVSANIPMADLAEGGASRLAFVTTMRLVWGAPMRIALYFVTALNKHYPGKFQLYLFSPYGNPDEGLVAAFQKQGVTVRWMDDSGGDELSGVDPQVLKAIQIRTSFAADKIEVAIFFRGDVILESLFSHVRIAPVQIFWSFGYDWPSFASMDGLLSCVPDAALVKQCDGRSWHWYRLLFAPTGPVDEQKAVETRGKIAGDSFVFGTLCQSFKLDSEDFISALTEILNSVPNAIYIWSGTYMPHNVVAMMKAYGIHERCVFVGWVDSNLYQRIIDVFLDTFPFGNGLSAAEAMSIGNPVVSMACKQNLKGLTFEPVKNGWFGEDDQNKFNEITKDGGYLLSHSKDDYIKTAVRLASDKDYYQKAGETSLALASEFLLNGESSAMFFKNAVEDIVKRTMQ